MTEQHLTKSPCSKLLAVIFVGTFFAIVVSWMAVQIFQQTARAEKRIEEAQAIIVTLQMADVRFQHDYAAIRDSLSRIEKAITEHAKESKGKPNGE